MGVVSLMRVIGVCLVLLLQNMYVQGSSSVLEVDSICALVDQCDTSPRQIMFLLDGSNTMNIDAFNNEMLTFIQKLHCIFPEGALPKLGLIVFNAKVEVIIPLANYTIESWIAAVEALRNTNLCCSCCTPHAEAFEVAHKEFAKYASEDALRTAVVVTDGVSHQNDGNGKYNRNKMPHAYYKAVTVPETAHSLKEDYDARVVVVNVPRKDGILTDLSFFLGNMSDQEFCSDNKNLKGASYKDFGCRVKDNGKTCCIDVASPPFPVVSTPLHSNICSLQNFTSSSMYSLIDRTVQVICNEAWVPTCKGPPKDVIFIVDASNSMKPSRFQNEMMTLVNNIFSSLNNRVSNRVGMILFGYNARVAIPIAQYSLQEFEAKINLIRNDNIAAASEAGACCACCTPTAEAFELARSEFLEHTDGSQERVAFMLTDGVPSRLRGDSKWGQDTISEDEYRDEIVPEQARLLQEVSRVVMLGVKNKHGDLPAESYFKDNSIASQPVDYNVLSANTWDLKELTETVHSMLCAALPTAEPTITPPTQYPTSFQPQVINEWEGGWVDGDGDCDASYEIKVGGKKYGPFTGCVRFSDYQPHLGQDPANMLVAPTNADEALWCPYNLNGVVYEITNTAIRKQWGYCHTYTTSKAPTTALPTFEPSPEPSTRPSKETRSPSTRAPSTARPTIRIEPSAARTHAPHTATPTGFWSTGYPSGSPVVTLDTLPRTTNAPTRQPTQATGGSGGNGEGVSVESSSSGHGCSTATQTLLKIGTAVISLVVTILL